MSDENTQDAYIVTVREVTVYLVAGAKNADEAEKMYNEQKGLKLQSQKNVAVAPRTAPTAPDDNTAAKK